MAERTVSQVLDETASRHGDRPALRAKRGGAWRTTTWRAYREQALRVGRALVALGVRPGEGVAILGYNAPEWVLADVGAILAGAWPAGIYTTSSAEQCRYIIGHCDAQVVFTDTAEQARKILAIRPELPALRTIVQWTGEPASGDVLAWDALVARGDPGLQGQLDARIAAQKPDDVCTLIYTSGTTGNPKSVMITHANCTWVSDVVTRVNQFSPDDSGVSYLPLSHVAEQVLTVHGPMSSGASVAFAESLETVAATLADVRPTAFFGVPRVWEKIQARMSAAGASAPPLRKRLVAWARREGLRGGYAEQRGLRRPALYGVADRVVFSKVRERLGFDRARFLGSGAAPISPDTLEYFLSLGLRILEVYGMSECTGPAAVSTAERYRTGKAGWVLPGTQIRIAEDGEILIRGPHVFKGYLKDPEATAAAIDAEGWLHSGDIGELDADGFLSITDRKKELIITAGGENISPQLVEGHLVAIPVVAQAVVIGDRQRYLAALLTLDREKVAAEASAAGSPAREPAEAASCAAFRAHLQKQIDAVNERLARVQTIKRFEILEEELTIEGGELTPTMKLKRRVIHAKYKARIEKLFA
jgi:long-subunit acyl-CoA synthetase (AMP-forming)